MISWYIDSNRLGSESEEWDDADYENWSDEYESFEVRLFDGQMPCYQNIIVTELLKKTKMITGLIRKTAFSMLIKINLLNYCFKMLLKKSCLIRI